MNKAGHIAAARRFMSAAMDLENQGDSRLAGEGVWGALCEASNALWAHPSAMEHDSRARIRRIRRIMAERVDMGLLSAADLKTLRNSIMPLHSHFYAGGMSENEFEAHSRAGGALVAKMLSIAERE